MAREGIAALVCATVLFTPLIPYLAAEPERDVASALAVQQALKQGREAIAGAQFGTAVHVLEQQLSRINGNREYLACLRDAYRGYVKELRQAGGSRADEAQTYLRRLEILDPGARMDFPDAPIVAANTPPPVKPTIPPVSEPVPIKMADPPEPENESKRLVRGKADEQPDPFNPKNRLVNPAAVLVASAHAAFLKKDFPKAGRLYEQAHEADAASVAGEQQYEWAYCKLFVVKEQYPTADGPALDRLEAEVKSAIALSSRLAPLGKEFLTNIQARRNGSGNATVRHLDKPISGWAVAESNYFRIFHQNNRELAGKVAQVAEQVRRDMDHKWFGDDTEWKYRCDLYIHPTAQAYSRATGKPANWTAHSTISLSGSTVTLRRIDLRGDDPDLLTASLPHEATHTVLAGHFGTHQVPRWADEGMALLSEPSARLDHYRHKLDEARQDGMILRVRDLMTAEEYPSPARAFAFYVQSVSLTEFLVKQSGGAQAFTRFVNEGLKGGYDTALQKVYGLDMGTLEQRWRAETFGGATQAAFRGADR